MTPSAAFRAPAARAAAVLLALEAIALLLLTGVQFVELIQGDLASVATSVALVVMSLAATVALAAFAVAVWSGRSWGRSGGVVAQVLIFAVAVGSVQGGAAHWGVAAALAVPAIVTFIALILAARQSRPPSSRD